MAWVFSEDGMTGINLDAYISVQVEPMGRTSKKWKISFKRETTAYDTRGYWDLEGFDLKEQAIDYLQYALEHAVKT